MSLIKVCGITDEEDALLCEEQGASFLGFIIYEKSKRYIPLIKALRIKDKIKKSKKVAVLVNPSKELLKECEKEFDFVQLHGDEKIDVLEIISPSKVIKVFRVNDKKPIIEKEWEKVFAFLFDKFSQKDYGGTGESFDWDIIKDTEKNYFIAGGINENNITKALSLKPFGIDLSSSLESYPGKKDREKVLRLFKIIREWKN